MSATWPGLASLLMDNVVPPGGTLVALGALDKNGQFRIAGAVLSPSQNMLVNDILKDGGISFADGMEYAPFDIEGVTYDGSPSSSPP